MSEKLSYTSTEKAVLNPRYNFDWVIFVSHKELPHAFGIFRYNAIVDYFSLMIRSSHSLSYFLLFLIVLILVSPVPISSGISTLRVIPVLAALALPVFILRKGWPLDKNILIFNFLYLLLVILSFEAIALDGNYRLMYLSTLIVAFALPLIRLRELNGYILTGTALIFFVLVLLNAEVLLTSAFFGGSRLDVLKWQKESAFIYGINKFLMGVYIVSVLFVISDTKKVYKYLIAFLYVFLAVFYGSRSHSLLAVTLIILNGIDIKHGNYKTYVHGLVKGGFVVFVGAFLIVYLIDYNVVLERTSNLVLNISSSNRWPIFEVFVSCLSEYGQLVGNDVLLCTQYVTYDLDNSFAFVIASSGIAGMVVFCSLLLWALVLLYKSRLDKKWVIYIFCSMLVILNVDILVYRPVVLLPVFVYMLRARNRHYRLGV